MRRIVALSSLAALAVPALLALSTGVAAASGTAPAPLCIVTGRNFVCSASAPVSPVNWTETITYHGTSSTSNFSWGISLRGTNCELGAGYTFSFSYVSAGVTYNSGQTSFGCTGISN
jgi:hypothetical protein